MKKQISLGLLALLFSCSVWAERLALFGVDFAEATRESMAEAINNSGGKKISSKGPLDIFDVSKVGVPGANKLTVLYYEGKLVLANYSLALNDANETKLRRILAGKYGLPFEGFVSERQARLFMQYNSSGEYRWKFDDGMEIQYKREFGSDDPKILTYVNKYEKKRMDAVMEAADNNNAKKEAESVKGAL